MRRPMLAAIVFVSGAVTLALEILAGRYLQPTFGGSLFSWSAVLAVTLVCLAAGYRWGGVLADRPASPATRLVLHLVIAAGWVAAVPLWGAPALALAGASGAAAGPIVAVLVLLAVPFVLLATVVPLAFGEIVRRRAGGPGALLGALFAWSTAGSVVGALAAGYLAVPRLGVSRSFFVAALLLFLAALPALLAGRGTRAAAVVLAALCAGYAVPPGLRGVPRLAPGLAWLHREASRYSQLDVLEDRTDGSRLLVLDGAIQSWVVPGERGGGNLDYVTGLLRGVARYETTGRRALVLGLGAGVLARELLERGWEVAAVEIDAAVVRVAAEYFELPLDRLTLHRGDARTLLRRAAAAGERFDLIVVDVTSGADHPAHVHNRDAYGEMKALLAPRGLLAINLVTFTWPPHDRAARHMAATAATLFSSVEAIDIFPETEETGDLSQLLLFASDTPPREAQTASIEAWPLAIDRSLRPLTDDWNPLALWSAAAHHAWYESTRQLLGAAILVPD